MCFNCILEWWSNTNELEKTIKLFPKKNRVRFINDNNGIISKVLMSFLHHVVNGSEDVNDICEIRDNPDFVYYDFKSRKYYNKFLRELKYTNYAYLGKYEIK